MIININIWLYLASLIAAGLIFALVWNVISKRLRCARAKKRIKNLRKSANSIDRRMQEITLKADSMVDSKTILDSSHRALLRAEETLNTANFHMKECNHPQTLEILAKQIEMGLGKSAALLQIFEKHGSSCPDQD